MICTVGVGMPETFNGMIEEINYDEIIFRKRRKKADYYR